MKSRLFLLIFCFVFWGVLSIVGLFLGQDPLSKEVMLIAAFMSAWAVDGDEK